MENLSLFSVCYSLSLFLSVFILNSYLDVIGTNSVFIKILEPISECICTKFKGIFYLNFTTIKQISQNSNFSVEFHAYSSMVES